MSGESITRVFSFGMGQAHHWGGFTWDPNILVCVTAPDPRAVMLEVFGQKWSMEYDPDKLTPDEVHRFWPRGIKELPGYEKARG